MDDGKRFYERPIFWPRLVGWIFLLAFVIAFRSEILVLLKLIYAAIQSLLLRPIINLPANTPTALLVLLANLIIYIGCYFIILGWVSLFVLPAHGSEERRKVYERLMGYVNGLHGPAVFVKNGELIARKDEEIQNEGIKARFASLAFVDLSSAIVLESGLLPPILGLSRKVAPAGEKPSPIRALGPGIGFLYSGERIRGTVDLRKQVRSIKGVHCFTSDGIELETSVDVIFTLGQLPDVITVIDTKVDGLHAIAIDRDTKKISISYKIDDADSVDLQSNLQGKKLTRVARLVSENITSNRPPFMFEGDHIISAVLSQPRNTSDGKLEKWTDLPAQVAVSLLLDELSRVTYDHLYSLDHPGPDCYLYDTFKPEFRRKVINCGVLSYQFVQRKDGMIPREGSIFKADEFVIWEVTELHNSKPIRDRGIKVNEAGFSDFKPIDRTVQEQRFDTWRSLWQKKTEITNAQYDLEIMREMNHARAHAQREIIYNLSQIFKLPGYTQDAMAIRVFQALESAAADPATNRLLPRDTVDMLRNFQRLLFSQGRDGQFPDDRSSDDRDNP
jgi:hypothetical protein